MMWTSPVIIGRAVTFSLSLIMALVTIYTWATDGTFLRKEVFTPWMVLLLIDFYILLTLFAGWICYKESTWARRLIWTVILIFFGSVAAPLYVCIEFFKLAVDDPVHLVLFKDRHIRKAG